MCARATSDWVIGCLALAVDWTERVWLDQLFRLTVKRVGLFLIIGWENFDKFQVSPVSFELMTVFVYCG